MHFYAEHHFKFVATQLSFDPNLELETQDGGLQSVLVLDDGVVAQLARVGQSAVDEPGEVRGGVGGVGGAVEPHPVTQSVPAKPSTSRVRQGRQRRATGSS